MTPRCSLAAVTLAVLLTACAAPPAEVRPQPVSAADFAGWPCDAISDEAERAQQRAADVAYAADVNTGYSVIAFTPGTSVFWPALLATRPDGPEAQEIVRLKGRYEALRSAATLRGCGPMMGEVAVPSSAAALPVALGERLVYEERAATGGPASELGLRLQSLKRGEFDFMLDRGRGSAGWLWRQDAAGNVLASQAQRLLSWTRLLHRDMALGDVLAGELHGPHAADRSARLRGQVIAVGPAIVSGRFFDAATIELFGDVPNGPLPARVDGVMVVDRTTGVLLRLDLRSGNPDFAVRRKLVRIEPAG